MNRAVTNSSTVIQAPSVLFCYQEQPVRSEEYCGESQAFQLRSEGSLLRGPC
jgi:hypothetical protein